MQEILLQGKSIGRINGILFDKDGTLINSEQRLLTISRSRINEAKKQFRKENFSSGEIYKLENLLLNAYGIDSKGINPDGALAIASKQDNLISTATIFFIINKNWNKSLEIANDIFSRSTIKILDLKNKNSREGLLAGASLILKESQSRNIKLGLISNDTRAGIRKFLQEYQLKSLFSCIWSAEDSPCKPNPNSIKKMCKLMNLNISECAFIGDSDTDMNMARKSGIKLALGYTAGWNRAPSLYEHHHLIRHWNELNFQDCL